MKRPRLQRKWSFNFFYSSKINQAARIRGDAVLSNLSFHAHFDWSDWVLDIHIFFNRKPKISTKFIGRGTSRVDRLVDFGSSPSCLPQLANIDDRFKPSASSDTLHGRVQRTLITNQVRPKSVVDDKLFRKRHLYSNYQAREKWYLENFGAANYEGPVLETPLSTRDSCLWWQSYRSEGFSERIFPGSATELKYTTEKNSSDWSNNLRFFDWISETVFLLGYLGSQCWVIS